MPMHPDHRKALGFAKAGQWSTAHEIVQQHHDKLSCLIHACVHRVEGDIENAGYWYGEAGEQPFSGSSQQELEHLESLIEASERAARSR